MIRVTKKKMGKRDITITEHFPDDIKLMDKIRDAIAEFDIAFITQKYPDEILDVFVPIYQRYLDLEKEGYSKEESEFRALKEYQEGQIKSITQGA